jgi:ABC-type spermidine/putrescine transport system permease subunit II
MDLGANGFTTFRFIILPQLATALPTIAAYYLIRGTESIAGSIR